jgi:hypothetical protein
MDWTNAIGDILQRYSGQGGGTAAAPADAHQDFQQVAAATPPHVVAGGIAQAFRSDQTPSFSEMFSNLFSQSDPNQRAGLLNRLTSSLRPGALAAVPGLEGITSAMSGGNFTPEQASQMSPAQVQQMAAHTERQNPSIVDEVSSFCAQHPQMMKAAGAVALSVAVQHMLKNR